MDAPSSSMSNNLSRGPSLRVSLAYVACMVLPVALVLAITSPKADAFISSIGPPRAATAQEQRAILMAVIEHEQSTERFPMFDEKGSRRVYALEDTTALVCGTPRQEGSPCIDIMMSSTEDVAKSLSAPSKLVAALPRFNARQQPLEIQALPGTILINRERIAAVFKKGGWEEFYRAYPQAAAILEFSRPALSARGNQAVLYAAKSYGNLGGEGWVAVLVLQQGQWKVVSRLGLWVS